MKTFLPTSAKELDERGWDYVDVVLFTGDAYVDHPSFGAAVIGRTLEAHGYRVAIVPQPNWRDDLRDFKKLGAPRLFFGVTSGSMDSMVNRYTANKRLRSSDAYTPGGRNDMRPSYAAYVYTQALKALFPKTPVVLGGIEASLRRLTHYDYWQDMLQPSILYDTRADMLVYGMGEKPIVEIAHRLSRGEVMDTLTDIPQTAFLRRPGDGVRFASSAITLHSFEECQKSKAKFAENFVRIEEESNKLQAAALQEKVKDMTVVVNPPYPPVSEQELDASFDLPYTRLPHPRYKNKRIAAYEMVKHSINIHRGCFGGCSFCTISMHQGKLVASRSQQSVLEEVKKVAALPDFKGYLSDVGGPSANMYRMQGKNPKACSKCARCSCLYPKRCANLNIDATPLLDLYAKIRALPDIKKAFVGSGIRYDLFLNEDGFLDKTSKEYFQTLLRHHVSGRLKVAPEHTANATLAAMRKPSYKLFDVLKRLFDAQNRAENLRLQLIPYFISSHPACTNADMQQLADITRRQGFRLEQVQDFTPTPMTLSSAMYYTGINPYTKEKIYVARTKEQKLQQNSYFFWYKRLNKRSC
ncbi:MAG: YgiQ family radical SAM protein [Prevotellaceae bacterium]|nr:YgiQ family radical SAM protein [Prevotellaceae bacterium]